MNFFVFSIVSVLILVSTAVFRYHYKLQYPLMENDENDIAKVNFKSRNLIKEDCCK